MKLLTSALAAVILATSMAVGCSESPHRFSENRPDIYLTPKATMQVGESKWVDATTHNLVGGKGIQWSVSPNVAHLTVGKDRGGQSALFTADQPGVYVITASADLGNGQIVTRDTTITVNGRTIVSDELR